MGTQNKPLIVTTTPSVELSCGHKFHFIGLDTDSWERREDGWYAARWCKWCNRKRSVVKVVHKTETNVTEERKALLRKIPGNR